ncbi:hypothetical protein EVG20_g7873 [Dentipellis fragilis]|uniref:CxC5 like cysteine cluster associated with KDZ domain-containing protein n=1 Tax=Dentipellis fragilis TaxID=205917 RepID=A0A4Y9YEA5_9AGAM|nr:hypothetical protein EVG20_g7873 [Dentipellis fragilis]
MASFLSCLHRHPELGGHLSLDVLFLLFRLLQCLKQRLSWLCPPSHTTPPSSLPKDVKHFLHRWLCQYLDPSEDFLDKFWVAYRDSVWMSTDILDIESLRSAEVLNIFQTYAVPEGIGFHDLYPPFRTCLDAECAKADSTGVSAAHTLTRLTPTKCVLFTREFGPVPVVSYSAQCRSCYTRYYPTYYIHEHRGMRTHYAGIPTTIHVNQHSYVETALAEQFTASMSVIASEIRARREDLAIDPIAIHRILRLARACTGREPLQPARTGFYPIAIVM